jgi:Rps23 Pro-64 3,4-dihydroxylase Tpa1-like proline 4-hydroxylase
MRMLDIARLEAAPIGIDPCIHIHVPGFVRADALREINRDYPDIRERGNFTPEELSYGPSFSRLLEELSSAELKAVFARKFDIDLTDNPLQLTARKFVDETDSGLHNDSRTKVITVLIYLNERWEQAGGKLRLTRNEHDFSDYTVECEPKEGNLLAFVRSATSFHGYLPCSAERRSIQMYWVKSKREQRDAGKAGSMFKKLKRFLKRG